MPLAYWASYSGGARSINYKYTITTGAVPEVPVIISCQHAIIEPVILHIGIYTKFSLMMGEVICACTQVVLVSSRMSIFSRIRIFIQTDFVLAFSNHHYSKIPAADPHVGHGLKRKRDT